MNTSRTDTLIAIGFIFIICSPALTAGQFVSIQNPKNGDNVSWRYLVEGSSSANDTYGQKVFLLIWPFESNGPWWVQPTETFSDGSWQSYAFFGRDPRLTPEDTNTHYRLVALLTKENITEGQSFSYLPDVPKSFRSKEIIVTRNNQTLSFRETNNTKPRLES